MNNHNRNNKEEHKFLERIAELEKNNQAAEEKIKQLNLVIKQKNAYIEQTKEIVMKLSERKLMKFNHLMFRIKGQLFNRSEQERKNFWKWINGKLHHTNKHDEGTLMYNPMLLIKNKLQEALACGYGDSLVNSKEPTVLIEKENMNVDLSEQVREILAEEYKKQDIVFLSVIDYNFRYQRPQHFASRFAENGHRVFYVNANFIRSDSVNMIAERLYEVDFSSTEHNAIYTMEGSCTLEWMKQKFDGLIFSYGIRDAVVVVDYPNWVYGAEYLRSQYGFKIVTDYMDDFTGFLGTTEEFLKDNCIKLLKDSDLVVTSSQFLQEVAESYTEKNKIRIIRNGTEVAHFYRAGDREKGKKWKNDRKVIGYYGAVSHWFAWEKVCYLAKKLPDCDIAIIGDVTEYRNKLEKYSNIYLLGEKKYTELPEHLAYFDVCLIPFDTSTDLIKATNPVKFYEYLSAGKKVVATEIPELMPYKNKYVYMANDDEQFLKYVELCLDGRDCLADKEACIAFTKENDWQKRYESFAEAVKESVPSVSVIVLTYNNLELNKRCINSILKNTAYPNYELIIVDNQSTDGTREYLNGLDTGRNPQLKVILNDKNSGFAGGNNIGIKAAAGKYVLLLNNDTEVTRGWITNLVKHMENDPKCGMCGSVTNSIGNEAMICVNYHNEKEMQEFSYAYTKKHMGEEYLDIDRLAMYCTLIRKEILLQSDGLDEGYQVGMFEDDDYAMEIISRGYHLVLAEDVFIHHVNNASFKKLDDTGYQEIFNQNRKRYEKKWNTRWKMPKYRQGVTANCNLGMQEIE